MKFTIAFLTLLAFAAVAYSLPVPEDDVEQYLQGAEILEAGSNEVLENFSHYLMPGPFIPYNFKKTTWCLCRTKKSKWCLCRTK
ncbi:hypothetical protein O3M35_006981 [Rhynocoris fuscipes]|uniref:Uncharacterized protein n=1 Tax=Rhynocoris fuscipes TaxID=488301 RepID=A0AAW1DG72_9HEMI